MFICPSKEEIKRKVEENAQYYLGIEIIMQNKPISTQQFSTNKFGTYRYVFAVLLHVSFLVLLCTKGSTAIEIFSSNFLQDLSTRNVLEIK